MRAFHFTTAKYAISALQNQRLKVATINDLNDPFELLCANLADKFTRHGFREFKKRQAEKYGLLSFSKGWANPLLWSHYGEKHCGIALEFEIHPDILEEVHYTEERPILKVEEINAAGGFTEQQAGLIFSTKSKHWEYESEVRVAVHLEDCAGEDNLYFEPFADKLRLAGVVVGALSTLTASDIAEAAPRGQKLRVQHARLAFKSFNIVPDMSAPSIEITGVR